MLDTEKLFTKAQEAFDKRNYDYAADLAKQIVELEPGHPKARHILRTSQIRKCESQGLRPSAVNAVISAFVPFMKVTIFKAMKNNVKLLPAAEDFISKNPYSVWVRTALADALQNLNYLESAINEFEGVAMIAPKQLHVLKSLGKLYIQVKDGRKAQQYFQAVLSLNPSDLDAPRALKDIAALSTLKEGGWSDAKSSRDLIKDKKGAIQLERETQIVKDSEISGEVVRISKMIAENPESLDNIKHYKKIAELCQRQFKYTEAIDAYNKLGKLNPNDATVKTKIGDIKILMFDAEIKKIQQKLQADPNNQPVKQALQKARQDKRLFQIEEYRKRVQDHPTDLALRYHLGAVLYANGNIDEATSEFQNSVRDPKRKIDSFIYIGRCFMAKKIYDMAISQFEKALESGSLTPEQNKDIHYNLAASHEANQNIPKALEEFKKILEIDINYKDTMKKVEQIQQKMNTTAK
ncbi:MAG: tetratricopeptide repeat protein [Candidatus Brocadiia bacterium]